MFGGDGSEGVVYDGDRDGDFPFEDPYDAIGLSVAGLGDINGDGFDDAFIGDPGFGGFYFAGSPGRSYLIFGRSDGFPPVSPLPEPGTGVLLRTLGRDNFAGVSQRVGDVNGDGLDDILVGAWRKARDVDNQTTGQAYLLFGRPDFGTQVLVLDNIQNRPGTGTLFTGLNNGDGTGSDVVGACDLNGDGIDDMLIGAYGADADGVNSAGVTYVVFGRTRFPPITPLGILSPQVGGDGSVGFVVKGSEEFDRVGNDVACGDVNADGRADLLLSPYVLFGRSDGFPAVVDLADLRPENGGDGSQGFLVSVEQPLLVNRIQAAGDLNGDGHDDMVVDLGRSNVDSFGPRVAAVLYGTEQPTPAVLELDSLRPGEGGDGERGFFLSAEPADEGLGLRRVASAGDFDGDGIGDLLIGHPNINADGVDPVNVETDGVTYLLFGTTDPIPAEVDLTDLRAANGGDGSAGIVFLGEPDAFTANTAALGAAVSSAGDLNGDGYDDLVIGAPDSPQFLGPEGGGAYVIFGRPRR
ncbi:MAG: integrin alpha [Pseudomonadota bacterium]